ncbi:Succinate dehydrogenase cytochrome b558 subunit [Desulfosporosinus sp. I2]|nr:Succinate dehydrogenase cytochrome b558 subunit [Desulfosporosinus sp. I2]
MSTTQKPYHFLIRRVHSLLGLVPIGIFLMFHMVLNLTALGGAELYNRIIHTMQSFPGIFIIELLIIFIPIALHAVYGTWVVYTGQSNILRYKYARNWFYIIQRISGLYTVLFVIIHVYLLRFGEANFAALQQFLSQPLGLFFYALGVIFAVFSFHEWTMGFCHYLGFDDWTPFSESMVVFIGCSVRRFIRDWAI